MKRKFIPRAIMTVFGTASAFTLFVSLFLFAKVHDKTILSTIPVLKDPDCIVMLVLGTLALCATIAMIREVFRIMDNLREEEIERIRAL